MLASMNEILHDAQNHHYAVGAFNTYNLELTTAILRAAESLRAPVILQLGTGALRYAGVTAQVGLNLAAAKAASVPVSVHLDHCPSLVQLNQAIQAGVTSVMIDGSHLSFADNVSLTSSAVRNARVPIEAELGRLSGSEDQARISAPAGELTDPQQAATFVESTGVDSLAVCIGNVHGFYQGDPHLDLERLAAIRACVPVPLVLHGTSGLPDQVIRAAIERGVVKFNVNTELRVAYFGALEKALAEPHGGYDVIRLMTPVITAVKQVVKNKIEVFGSAGR